MYYLDYIKYSWYSKSSTTNPHLGEAIPVPVRHTYMYILPVQKAEPLGCLAMRTSTERQPINQYNNQEFTDSNVSYISHKNGSQYHCGGWSNTRILQILHAILNWENLGLCASMWRCWWVWEWKIIPTKKKKKKFHLRSTCSVLSLSYPSIVFILSLSFSASFFAILASSHSDFIRLSSFCM